MPGTPPDVRHAPAQNRFEVELPGGPATLDYRLDGRKLVILHTEVPEEASGDGLGGALVRAVMDHARQEGLRVIPLCPFARGYLDRHPEYAELVDEDFTGRSAG